MKYISETKITVKKRLTEHSEEGRQAGWMELHAVHILKYQHLMPNLTTSLSCHDRCTNGTLIKSWTLHEPTKLLDVCTLQLISWCMIKYYSAAIVTPKLVHVNIGCMSNAKLEIFLQMSFIFFLLLCFFEGDRHDTSTGWSTTAERELECIYRNSIVDSCSSQ